MKRDHDVLVEPQVHSKIAEGNEQARGRENRLLRGNVTRVSSRSVHARYVTTRQAISSSLACSFSSTIPERKERLLVV